MSIENFITKTFQLHADAFKVDFLKDEGLSYENEKRKKNLAACVEEKNVFIFIGLMRMFLNEELTNSKLTLREMVDKTDYYLDKVSSIKSLKDHLYFSSEAVQYDSFCDDVVSTVENYTGKKIDDSTKADLIDKASDLTNTSRRYIQRCEKLSLGTLANSVLAPDKLNELVLKVKDFNEIPSLVSSLPLGFTVLILESDSSSSYMSEMAILGKTEKFSLVLTVTTASYMKNNYDREQVKKMQSELFWSFNKEPNSQGQLPQIYIEGSSVEKIVSIKDLDPKVVFNILNLVSLIKADWQEHCSESKPIAIQSSFRMSHSSCAGTDIQTSDNITPIPILDNSLSIASTEAYSKAQIEFFGCNATNLLVTDDFEEKYSELLAGEDAVFFQTRSELKSSNRFGGKESESKIEYNFLESIDDAKMKLLMVARGNRTAKLQQLIKNDYEEKLPLIKEYVREKALDNGFAIESLAKLDSKLLSALTEEQVKYLESNALSNGSFGIEREKLYNGSSFIYSPQYKLIRGKYNREAIHLNEFEEESGKALCPISKAYAQFYIVLSPEDVFDLELILGEAKEEMSHYLGFYGLSAKKLKNSHADPMNYIKNQFLEVRYSIVLGLSTTGLNTVRKKLGLDKISKKDLISRFGRE